MRSKGAKHRVCGLRNSRKSLQIQLMESLSIRRPLQVSILSTPVVATRRLRRILALHMHPINCVY